MKNKILNLCIQLFIGQFLPKHVGIPMGGNGGPKYYMLEIHYDNPKSKKGKEIKRIFYMNS